MKKLIIYSLSILAFIYTSSCEKGDVDLTLPPIIEQKSDLDAENQVNFLISEGKDINFLVDLQEDEIWKACENNSNNSVVVYGIEARLILSVKQKKVDKKLRNVVTIYSGLYNIYVDSDYLANIYNNQKIRFYKATTSVNRKSTKCTSLAYYFSTAESLGGVLLK